MQSQSQLRNPLRRSEVEEEADAVENVPPACHHGKSRVNLPSRRGPPCKPHHRLWRNHLHPSPFQRRPQNRVLLLFPPPVLLLLPLAWGQEKAGCCAPPRIRRGSTLLFSSRLRNRLKLQHHRRRRLRLLQHIRRRHHCLKRSLLKPRLLKCNHLKHRSLLKCNHLKHNNPKHNNLKGRSWEDDGDRGNLLRHSFPHKTPQHQSPPLMRW